MLQMSFSSALLSTDEVVSVWLLAACITEVGKVAHGFLFLSEDEEAKRGLQENAWNESQLMEEMSPFKTCFDTMMASARALGDMTVDAEARIS